jgi:hypothetical protein
MSFIIRFGYCPPNPGPRSRFKCKWFTDVLTLLDNYKEGDDVFVSHNGGKYIHTTIDKIVENFYGDSLKSYVNDSILQL